MSTIRWANAVNGDFSDTSGWTGGKVPGGQDTASLGALGGADYTVTVTGAASRTVDAIEMAANASLDIAEKLFYARSGSGGGADAGVITVDNGAGFRLTGGFDNTGSVILSASSQPTSLAISGSVTLTGGGMINLSDSVRNRIYAMPGGVLTNVDNTIAGAGAIGLATPLTLINEAAGVIDATDSDTALKLSATVTNAGLIEATGAGSLLSLSGGLGNSGRLVANGGTVSDLGSVTNTGTLMVDGGVLTLVGAVSGAGGAVIDGGTLQAQSTFTENVDFTGATGGLTLFKSQGYGGEVSGFSTSAGTQLDLRDIGFVSISEATFNGTTSGGVLTVTDGTHTANIDLVGNYTKAVFTSAGDGAGGVVVEANLPTAVHWAKAISGDFTTAADWTGGVVPGLTSIVTLDAPGSTPYTVTVSTTQSVNAIQTAADATLDITGNLTVTNGTGSGVNAGVLEATGTSGYVKISNGLDNSGQLVAGGGVVSDNGSVTNTGTLVADGGGFLAITGAVSGAGGAMIDGGTLETQSTFDEDVAFTGTTGKLVLFQSPDYDAAISGFSTTGGTQLDLRDIAFVSTDEATFSGTTSGGVLTVSDGTHTAKINLVGDYTDALFVSADDNGGGVTIKAEPPPQPIHWASAVNGDFTTAADWTGAPSLALRMSPFSMRKVRRPIQ